MLEVQIDIFTQELFEALTVSVPHGDGTHLTTSVMSREMCEKVVKLIERIALAAVSAG